jgi:hypothetical protein
VTELRYDLVTRDSASRALAFTPSNSLFTKTVDPEQEGPAVNIPGVPDSIDWSDVKAFLERIGIDLHDVPRDNQVTIGYDSITCKVMAKNEKGNRYLALDGKTVAMHHVSIPIRHPEHDTED